MNSGVWISFPLSSGRSDRLLATGRATPPCAISAGVA